MTNGLHLNNTRNRITGTTLPYIRISAGPQRGMYVHRLVMEAKLGRRIRKSETVDHIDGNSLNNHPANLRVLSWAQHGRETQRRIANAQR